MKNDFLYIFRDHSDMKGILTYNEIKDVNKYNQEISPRSIIQICKNLKLDQCFGVSRFMNSFYDAWKNLKRENIQYNFGLELLMCNDAKIHNEESLKNNHKINIFFKNEQGYKDLIKIYTECHANIDNFYYESRFDYNQLKKLWTDNLIFVIPFFDSFLHKNLLTFASIVPDFPCKPILFREIDCDLPFVDLINKAIDKFNINNDIEIQNIKTIYYQNKDDVKQHLIYRTIQNDGTWQKPELEFYCSNKFNIESKFIK